MKSLQVVVLIMTLVLTVCTSFISAEAAGQFIGDICWKWEGGDGVEDPTIIKAGIFHLGGTHCLWSGTIHQQSDFWRPVHGNIEVVDNEIQMSIVLVNTYPPGEEGANGDLYHCVLDSSLNGNCAGVHTHAGNTWSDVKYDTNTLTFIPCQ